MTKQDRNIRNQTMKPRSIATLDEAIHYFNICLQRNPELEITYDAGLKKHVPDFGNNQIELYLITGFQSKENPVHGSLTARSFYGFDDPFPTKRKALVIPDVRDFFARSLLKRPASARLGFSLNLGNAQLFTAGYGLDGQGKPDLAIGMSPALLPPARKYRELLEMLGASHDFNGVMDVAFNLYRESSK